MSKTDKKVDTDGIFKTLRANAKALGLGKEFDADPQAVIDAMMKSRKPVELAQHVIPRNYYESLYAIEDVIRDYQKKDPEAYLRMGSTNIRTDLWIDHFEQNGLLSSDEMNDPSYGFNPLVTFNLALQEIIDIFPRAESGQIIASLYHVNAFVTVCSLVTARNKPIPLTGIGRVLGMNTPTTTRTLAVLSDGSVGTPAKVYRVPDEETEEEKAKRLEWMEKDLKSRNATVNVTGVQADGKVGEVVINNKVIGENRLGLITRVYVSDKSPNPAARHMQLTDKGLMLASRIKEILDAKAKWARKSS